VHGSTAPAWKLAFHGLAPTALEGDCQRAAQNVGIASRSEYPMQRAALSAVLVGPVDPVPTDAGRGRLRLEGRIADYRLHTRTPGDIISICICTTCGERRNPSQHDHRDQNRERGPGTVPAPLLRHRAHANPPSSNHPTPSPAGPAVSSSPSLPHSHVVQRVGSTLGLQG
jgi:hypothetical protein